MGIVAAAFFYYALARLMKPEVEKLPDQLMLI
jgi:hypothetical protein